jgi:hypothetical protein
MISQSGAAPPSEPNWLEAAHHAKDSGLMAAGPASPHSPLRQRIPFSGR